MLFNFFIVISHSQSLLDALTWFNSRFGPNARVFGTKRGVSSLGATPWKQRMRAS